ncbi:hypothetical protein NM208_g2794 [Fusarium decemcellulare]|uniref:Uncharacterized protein n=1 Tax=Fusarium decemcellulare TaxID=57161 RepID=A0ACC1SRM4_9HYPO|nr:hypothetical protein NM208_g2794 [Fusarium decemcellulare]
MHSTYQVFLWPASVEETLDEWPSFQGQITDISATVARVEPSHHDTLNAANRDPQITSETVRYMPLGEAPPSMYCSITLRSSPDHFRENRRELNTQPEQSTTSYSLVYQLQPTLASTSIVSTTSPTVTQGLILDSVKMSRVPLSDAERRELHYAEVDRVYQEECRQRARDGSTGGRVQGQTAGPCVNCGSTRHKLNHCLPAPEGTIKGCTLCHTMSHCVDQCARFRNMSLKERVEILVLDRINMPALDTYNSWFHSFRDLSATPGQDNTVTLPGRFPWTSGYSRDISGNPRST